ILVVTQSAEPDGRVLRESRCARSGDSRFAVEVEASTGYALLTSRRVVTGEGGDKRALSKGRTAAGLASAGPPSVPPQKARCELARFLLRALLRTAGHALNK